MRRVCLVPLRRYSGAGGCRPQTPANRPHRALFEFGTFNLVSTDHHPTSTELQAPARAETVNRWAASMIRIKISGKEARSCQARLHIAVTGKGDSIQLRTVNTA